MIRRPPRSTLFPYTSSSDLLAKNQSRLGRRLSLRGRHPGRLYLGVMRQSLDRKSTRLNSSHQIISYAVFCLKKKNKKKNHDGRPDENLGRNTTRTSRSERER